MALKTLLLLITLAHANTLDATKLKFLKPLDQNQKVTAIDGEKDKILYFWATWCPACKDKLTTMLNDKSLLEKFDIYLVATDEDKEKIAHYQRKYKVPPYVVLDENRTLQKDLNIVAIPTFVRLRKIPTGFSVVSQVVAGELEDIVK